MSQKGYFVLAATSVVIACLLHPNDLVLISVAAVNIFAFITADLTFFVALCWL